MADKLLHKEAEFSIFTNSKDEILLKVGKHQTIKLSSRAATLIAKYLLEGSMQVNQATTESIASANDTLKKMDDFKKNMKKEMDRFISLEQ